MTHCLISIVTISKNNLSGLSRTLKSVNEQTYEQIEHIVIDGDSNDGTKELLQSYSHSKLYSYSSEADNGISSAFNKGLEKSNGDLIFFLNSGDELFSNNVIYEVVENYLQYKWKCAIGVTVTKNFAGETIFYRSPQLPSSFLKYFMFLPHQGFFCETSLHKNYTYDESFKLSMDYELFILMLKGVKIFYLPIVTSIREPGGISGQTEKRIIEHSHIRLKYANTILEKTFISILNVLILIKGYLKIDSPFALKKWSN